MEVLNAVNRSSVQELNFFFMLNYLWRPANKRLSLCVGGSMIAILTINFPVMAFVVKDFPAPNGQFIFDAFHYFVAGGDGRFPVLG